MKSIVSLIFISLIILFARAAEESNDSNHSHQFVNVIQPGITIKTYRAATNDSNQSQWTMKDYEHATLGDHSNGRIVNMQATFGNTKIGKAAMTDDFDKVNRNALMHNSDLNDTKSISAFSRSIREDAISKAVHNSMVSVRQTDEKLHCYITRDIPFRYRCVTPGSDGEDDGSGVVYGGDMNSGGAAALKECISNCYTQYSCINVGANSQDIDNNITISFRNSDSGDGYIPENGNGIINLDSNITTSKIIVHLFYDGGENSRDDNMSNISDNLTIIAKRPDNTSYYLVKNLRIYSENPANLYIGERIKSLKVSMGSYSGQYYDNNITLKIETLQQKSEQWICPELQDLDAFPHTDFADLCPSGRTIQVGDSSHHFTVCTDHNNYGDNANGTFSSQKSCNSICRKANPCVPDNSRITSDGLETFREGCIEGQTNCTRDKCKNARLSGAKIIDEKVFDASRHFRHTIVNSVEIANSNRPKILLSDDLNFSQRSQQEWKDGAYRNMVINGTYNDTNNTIEEDTKTQYAYATGIKSGVGYGVSGSIQRVIYLKLKPNAYSVDTNTESYIYAMLKVDLEYFAYNIDGILTRQRNEIWYFKTAMDQDVFVPKRFFKNYSYTAVDDNNRTSIVTNGYSTPREQEFNEASGRWVNIDTNSLAPYFLSTVFTSDDIYHNYPIINNVGNLVNTLKGIWHRRDNYAQDSRKYYTGQRDGTAESVVKYRIYAYMSNRKLTLQEFYNKVDSGEVPMIYESLHPFSTPNELQGDGERDGKNIQIYTYGKIENKAAFTRIRPKKNDVGKKGFIFVFAQ